MIIKTKCCLLKKGINPSILEQYGFETVNDGHSYWRDIEDFCRIGWYHDTRRFVYKYPRRVKAKKVSKYIKDLLDAGLVEIKYFYEYLVIFGRWQNFSDKKLARINDKLDKLNEVKEYD